MDKPLLALTRARHDAAAGGVRGEAADAAMEQLAQLRWLAVTGQVAAIIVAHHGLGVSLPLIPMLAIAVGLALFNLMIAVAPRRVRGMRTALAVALTTDIAGLTGQLYLSGGTSNPFVSLYLLQVALASILLTPTIASALALVCGAGYGLLSVANRPLVLPDTGPIDPAQAMLVGDLLAFMLVSTLLVLFVVRISRNLRARDAHLAQLRERDAQEAGVLRVGMFASGAAHELSTPLSSLAVLVGDWQRHPVLAADPELREELADAAAEVQRCKSTVSRILESAGRARGEPMGTVAIRELLEDIARDWTRNNDLALGATMEDLQAETVVADPALHQAITSLLDNARDAGSTSVELRATADEDQVCISVLDQGPGFTEDALAELGRPFCSSKGRGRGMGLFLAATVARRLGGRLEASNRTGGGAAVTVRLPITGR